MPVSRSPRHLAVAALLAALPLAANATADWLAAAATCAPTSLETLQSGVVNAARGYVTSGRNPPQVYACAVGNPDDVAGPASWKWLKLQYLDPSRSGGGVVARLYAKRRSTGAISLLAEAASQAGGVVSVVSVPLAKAVDFRGSLYHVVITLDSPSTPVQAHAVMLTTN